MIARVWKGITTQDNAEAYVDFLTTELVKELSKLPGFQKLQILKLVKEDRVEFTTQIFFDSLATIGQFAGNDYEKAHIPERAAKLLHSYDDRVNHYEVVWE